VWSLQNEAGFATWSDEEAEEPIVPLWSDRDVAGDCASTCFPGYQPESISLDTLLGTLLPQLEDRGFWLA
jgi:hypothetical protein